MKAVKNRKRTITTLATRAAMSAMTGILLLLSFVSCGRADYQYNNLISEEDRTEFSEIMASAGIPDLDAGAILEYVGIYSNGDFSKEALVSGWQQTTRSYKKIYDYTNGWIGGDTVCKRRSVSRFRRDGIALRFIFAKVQKGDCVNFLSEV